MRVTMISPYFSFWSCGRLATVDDSRDSNFVRDNECVSFFFIWLTIIHVSTGKLPLFFVRFRGDSDALTEFPTTKQNKNYCRCVNSQWVWIRASFEITYV